MSDTLIPAKWMSNPHIQTLWPFVFRKAPALVRRRECFNTPDNDFFDVVARLHGFDDVHDYYKKNSSIGFLKGIKTNTLLIQAIDDSFLTPDVLPLPE